MIMEMITCDSFSSFFWSSRSPELWWRSWNWKLCHGV